MMKRIGTVFAAVLLASPLAFASAQEANDGAWLKGTTDKGPLAYRCGETMTFTVTPVDFAGSLPEGACSLNWKRTDDHGGLESGRVPFDGKTPFVYRGKLDKPGFVRLEASVDYAAGGRFGKKSFFDGGACADAEKVVPAEEPKDFDEFWKRQFARLDRVPIKADRIEVADSPTNATIYAVRVDCAGLRPVTGYLTVPKGVAAGRRYPARLQTHGYNGDSCNHSRYSVTGREPEIIFNINAHGLKLKEFGATDADTKALRWEIRSNGHPYALDPLQNADAEVTYFNGMVLRVKRALQYLKTVEGWNGRDLIASGGSQGGLQTIWAAGCGEGVTCAESGITWCCDMEVNASRTERKLATGGWYVPWTPVMSYYDSVNFARRIPASCRTVITRAGLGDYVCPPLGLLKLYYAIPGNKEIHWMQGSEHGYQPPAYEGRDTRWSAFRIASYNIRHGWGMDGVLSVERAGTVIAAERPRFAGVQEVDQKTQRVNGEDSCATLERTTGLRATFAKAIDFDGGEYGVAVLSRETPKSVRRIPLPGAEPRVLLLCEFDDCWFGTTHLAVDSEEARTASVALIRDAVAACAPKPVFLTGDWNSLPSSSVLKGLRGFMTILSEENVATFHGGLKSDAAVKANLDSVSLTEAKNHGQCIDYVAVSSCARDGWCARDRRVVPNARVSDHFPVVVEVEYQEPTNQLP